MPQDNTNTTEIAKWYVVHTYSGYENKVKDTLEKAVENRGMQHLVQEVVVPMEEQIEIADYLNEKIAQIDSIIADKQNQVSTLIAYRKSLIFEYVTGKKEVALS